MSNDSSSFQKVLLVLSVASAWSCCSCSAVTRQVARDATPAAIDSGIEAGLSEKNQEAVAEKLEPEHVERATEKVTAAATDGWVSAMGGEERQRSVVAAVAPVVESLVNESIEAALTDEHLLRVRELAKQATLGFQDAIDEVAEQRDKGAIPSEKGNVLEAVDKVAESGSTTLYMLGALAALFAVLLGAGLVWALGRRRRYDREAARRDQAFEAAARMLSRQGVRLEEPPAQARGEHAVGREVQVDVDADADAELVRSAVRRMRSGPQGSTKKETRA